MCYHCLRCFSFSITIIKYFWLWAISFLSTSLHAPLYRTPPLCIPSPSTEHPIMYTLTLYRTPHHVHPHSLQNTPLCTPSLSTEHPIMYTLTLYRTPHYVHPHSLQNTPSCIPSLSTEHPIMYTLTLYRTPHYVHPHPLLCWLMHTMKDRL